MEGKEENNNTSSGVTVKADEAPDSFRAAPKAENPGPGPLPGPTVAPATATSASPVSMVAPEPRSAPGLVPGLGSTPGEGVGAGTGTGTGTEMKKKRGRPRKYGPDGKLSMALSPMPISSSIPLTGDFSAWKRGRGRPHDSIKKSYKFEHENPGEKIAYFVGANFTPHVLTINTGEDVMMKLMSFAQQGSRAICILSANGTISNVTLRQPTSSGGTLTYEGRFEILSLSGSFMPTENGGTKSRSGGMSVSLAGPDGRVVGGGLAGLLIAAGPVQVVVGSFLPGHQQEQKHKKQRTEPAPSVTPIPITVSTLPAEEMKGSYGGIKPVVISSSFLGDNSTSLNPIQDFRNLAADNKTSSPDEESKGPSQSNCEVSC